MGAGDLSPAPGLTPTPTPPRTRRADRPCPPRRRLQAAPRRAARPPTLWLCPPTKRLSRAPPPLPGASLHRPRVLAAAPAPEGKRIRNGEEADGRGKKGSLARRLPERRDRRPPPATFRARAHAPARSASGGGASGKGAEPPVSRVGEGRSGGRHRPRRPGGLERLRGPRPPPSNGREHVAEVLVPRRVVRLQPLLPSL